MTMILSVLWITALAGMGGTGLGGVVGALFMKRDSNRTVSLLLSFAAGVMLSVVCFDLVPGAIRPDGSEVQENVALVCFFIAVGFVVVWSLNYLIDRATNHEVSHIDKNHPKTADDLDELYHANHLAAHERGGNKYQLFLAGIVMAAAIALHNLPEGMVIGASFAEGGGYQLSGGGILIAAVIGLHNIPEGMAVAVPLVSGGMSRVRAVAITALSGAPTILGAVLGYYLGLAGPLMLSLSLSFASGAMLYVVAGELLPEAFLMLRSKEPAFGILIGMLVGIFLVYV